MRFCPYLECDFWLDTRKWKNDDQVDAFILLHIREVHGDERAAE